MKRTVNFVKENTRFALAILANAVALTASVWWFIDSNWNTKGSIQIEPIVSCIALTATLLGLHFVNDKLTKPHLKVSLSMAIADHPIHGIIHGIGVEIQNHSMLKAFIKNFQVLLPEQKQVVQFLYEGFTDQPLPKVIIEPGQTFSFHIVKKNLNGAPKDINKYGDFIVTTDIGYKFSVPAKTFREHFESLMRAET